jgi:hypothetical protein
VGVDCRPANQLPSLPVGRLRHNPVCAARFTTSPASANNPLCHGQARAAIAVALLRQLFVVVTRRVARDPASASSAWEAALHAHDATVDVSAHLSEFRVGRLVDGEQLLDIGRLQRGHHARG